jgi:xylulokinase
LKADTRILAIDIGTEGCKSAIFASSGKTIASSYLQYDANYPQPGWAEQNPDHWWNAIRQNLKILAFQTGNSPLEIDAIGICGQMHAPVPIDDRGKLVVRSVPLWCDKRSDQECQDIERKVGRSRLLEITGNLLNPAWTAPKILWLARHTDSYARTWKFLTAKDYVVYRLTNACATDWSEASGTGLYDANQAKWSSLLCDAFGIDKDKLPTICPSQKVVGEVTRVAGSQLAIPYGVPVVAGGGDFLCAVLGSGVVSEGAGVEITGTAAVIATYSRKLLVDRRILNLHHVIEGWVPFGIVDSGGALLKWLLDRLTPFEGNRSTRRGSSYAKLDAEVERTHAGADGLVVDPSFMGERILGNSRSRGALVGLTLAHRRAHLARAMMEGVCYALNRYLEAIEELGKPVASLRLAGGGAKSKIWSSIKADIYGKECLIPRQSELGLLGAMILAGAGIGVFSDARRTATELNERPVRIVKPSREATLLYRKYYETYLQIHKDLQKYSEKLSELDESVSAHTTSLRQ